MKKLVFKVIALIFLFALVNYAGAQDKYTFRYTQEELIDVQNPYDVRSHYLGDDIAKKFQLLKESYTTIHVDEVAQRENTVVEKSSIYYSCKKIGKYLTKAVKKGEMSLEQAQEQMNHVLTVALNIRYQETEAFEDVRWDIKDPFQALVFYKEKVDLDM